MKTKRLFLITMLMLITVSSFAQNKYFKKAIKKGKTTDFCYQSTPRNLAEADFLSFIKKHKESLVSGC